MTPFRLILRSLWFHRRTHLGVVGAAAVATAAIVGALMVGDSIRLSLRNIALARLGETRAAMVTGERFVRAELADAIATEIGSPVAAAIDLPAVASMPGGKAKVAGVHAIGVDAAFWKLLGGQAPFADDARDAVAVNRRLAMQLGVSEGDTLLLRIARPGALSREVPLGSDPQASTALRAKLVKVIDDDAGGRYSLAAEQVSPFNAFLPIERLRSAASLEGRTNLLLVGGEDAPATATAASKALNKHFTLSDAQAELVSLEKYDAIELRSERVFLDEPLVLAAGEQALPAVTWFVRSFDAADRSTPYSMLTALDPADAPFLPEGMRDDQIALTDWLADDLGVDVGDTVRVVYDRMGGSRKLERAEASFEVVAITTVEPPGGDRELMPRFPGLSDVDSPLDWEPPEEMQLDMSLIRDKDEKWWEQYRGAPKAFVTLAWGREHFATAYGQLTTLRWSASDHNPASLEASLVARLDPAALGMVFRDVRSPALRASEQGYDFGQLFLGFSFFVIAAALLLTALMFAFGIDQRSGQIGLLVSVGLTAKQVRRLLLYEGLILAACAAAAGVPLGVGYTAATLWGLENLWQSATGLSAVTLGIEPASLAIGGFAGLLTALCTIAIVLRKRGKEPPRALLASKYGLEAPATRKRGGVCRSALFCLFGAIACIAAPAGSGSAAAGWFFGAGALLLAGGLLQAGHWLGRGGRGTSTFLLGWRNSGRRRGRSLATAAMLACGAFLLVAVNSFRHDAGEAPAASTLGFALWAETALPLHHDLASPAGREAFTLDAADLADTRIVPMRRLEGDDASCLNLNRPQNPPLLAIDPQAIDAEPFKTLAAAELPDGHIPALVDGSVAQWVLHKKVGDSIDYVDEQGQTVSVTIVALLHRSIFQGNLVVPLDRFAKHFPSRDGSRVLLVDAPPERVPDVKQTLEEALGDLGLVATTTPRRLAMFNEVENTYLSIFGVLGGLGLLLGSAGLGLVVLRNVYERRAELATLQAVGLPRRRVRGVVLAEHQALVLLGLGCGVVAALLAIAPSLLGGDAGVPWLTLAVTLLLVGLGAMGWVAVATRLATRGRLIGALRDQ